MEGNASKNGLRRVMKSRRRNVSADAREAYSAALCAHLTARGDMKSAMARKGVFAVYLASDDEIDLSVLIERLWTSDCKVVVPAWRNGTYKLVGFDSGTKLVPGPMGILEPEALGAGLVTVDEEIVDVWIVPGLAFTRSGARMGYGGGWYDRFLAKSGPSAISIGVAYPFQIVESLPLERHDLPLSDLASIEI